MPLVQLQNAHLAFGHVPLLEEVNLIIEARERVCLIGRNGTGKSTLLNVLNGTMSLVGPRPMMPEQRSLYPGDGYFNLQPGITGLWQISDRNHCEFSGRAYYDDLYDRTVSLRTDLSILINTVGVVLRGTGY